MKKTIIATTLLLIFFVLLVVPDLWAANQQDPPENALVVTGHEFKIDPANAPPEERDKADTGFGSGILAALILNIFVIAGVGRVYVNKHEALNKKLTDIRNEKENILAETVNVDVTPVLSILSQIDMEVEHVSGLEEHLSILETEASA